MFNLRVCVICKYVRLQIRATSLKKPTLYKQCTNKINSINIPLSNFHCSHRIRMRYVTDTSRFLKLHLKLLSKLYFSRLKVKGID